MLQEKQDFCDTYIILIHYSGASVFVCAFHREQAWNRWLVKGTNNAASQKDEILKEYCTFLSFGF